VALPVELPEVFDGMSMSITYYSHYYYFSSSLSHSL
jgi:hypothetical protein